MQNAGLDESQARIKFARRINLRYADDTTLMAQSELKSLLMKVKRRVKKLACNSTLKKTSDHDTQSHHFVANEWGKRGNSDRFYFLGLQNHCGL